jgi:hypothetical protein
MFLTNCPQNADTLCLFHPMCSDNSVSEVPLYTAEKLGMRGYSQVFDEMSTEPRNRLNLFSVLH